MFKDIVEQTRKMVAAGHKEVVLTGVDISDYGKDLELPMTLSQMIKRWKNMDQINDCGVRAADKYDGVNYWTYNWRKGGGGARMYEIAKDEKFYKQEYCGCIYSLRDTNKWRKSKGREEIEIGQEFYDFVEKCQKQG